VLPACPGAHVGCREIRGGDRLASQECLDVGSPVSASASASDLGRRESPVSDPPLERPAADLRDRHDFGAQENVVCANLLRFLHADDRSMHLCQVVAFSATEWLNVYEWHTVACMTDIARIVPKAKNAVNVRVGRNVRDIMFMRDVNQVRMALELGLTESQVSRRISGSVDWTPADIEKTAQVLDVRIERLFQELPELDSKVRTSD
jgi:hypothetical protein